MPEQRKYGYYIHSYSQIENKYSLHQDTAGDKMELFRRFLFFQLLQNLIFLLEKLKLKPYQGGILITHQDLLVSHLGIKQILRKTYTIVSRV